jgi:hypothetical protein
MTPRPLQPLGSVVVEEVSGEQAMEIVAPAIFTKQGFLREEIRGVPDALCVAFKELSRAGITLIRERKS